MVTVTTSAPVSQHANIVTTMLHAMRGVSSITPRPKHQLLRLLHSNDIALAFDDDTLIGWLIAIPYSPTTQELGMAYTAPEYRNQGIFDRMMDLLVTKRPISVAVTFEARLVKRLADEWQFTPTTLVKVATITKGKFIVSRFHSFVGVIAMLSHVSKAKPLYMVRDTHEE